MVSQVVDPVGEAIQSGVSRSHDHGAICMISLENIVMEVLQKGFQP